MIATARTVADLLNLSIVLATQPDGRVTLGGALWGRRDLNARFARFVARRLPAGSIESTHLTGMGTALGVHGGPDTLIVGVQRLAG